MDDDMQMIIPILLTGMMLYRILSVHKNKRKRNRKYWVRPWVSRRYNRGIINMVNNELLIEDPIAFKNYLRMSNESFEKLLVMVDKYISKEDTVMRECISSRDKLMITLRFLASGETYRNLMYSSRIHESTISQFVPAVCRAIYTCLRDYMKVPTTTKEWEQIAEDFYNLWQIPNTIGALDGKHIAFSPPASSGSTFYNYKGFHSIILLALVDSRYRFIYVDIGVNGRVSDGGVFAQSDLYRALERKTLNIPADKALPGRVIPVPYVIIADAAFPLKNYIMKPYPFRGLSESQTVFNYRLSRGRRVVENAFGILSNRFRILLRTINLSPKKVEEITLACCTLHNFLLEESSNYRASVEESISKISNRNIGIQSGNRSSNRSVQIREEFKEYFTGIGAVPWQQNIT